MEIKTVRVVGPEEAGGFVVINESDFDEKVHELYVEPQAGALKVAELKALLDAKGIKYEPTAKKAELQALLDAAPKD